MGEDVGGGGVIRFGGEGAPNKPIATLRCFFGSALALIWLLWRPGQARSGGCASRLLKTCLLFVELLLF